MKFKNLKLIYILYVRYETHHLLILDLRFVEEEVCIQYVNANIDLEVIFFTDGRDATEETQLASEQITSLETEDAFYVNQGAMLTPVSF